MCLYCKYNRNLALPIMLTRPIALMSLLISMSRQKPCAPLVNFYCSLRSRWHFSERHPDQTCDLSNSIDTAELMLMPWY